MFSTSSQKQFWTFECLGAIDAIRDQANRSFIAKFGPLDEVDQNHTNNLLSYEEEKTLCKLVGETALKFCKTFVPGPLPSSVVWTAFTYFKRFYLRESVMQHYPKNVIMSCLYLACKIDEFNVSIDEFVNNLKSGDPESNREIICSYEPVLLQTLDYHLTVHCPFRPLEGHLIEFKARLGESAALDSEKYRPNMECFFDKALLTDVPLLYPPSQISLAAISFAASINNHTAFEQFLAQTLCPNADICSALLNRINAIIQQVSECEPLSPDDTRVLQERVKECFGSVKELNNLTAKSTQDNDNNLDEDDD